MLLLSLSGPTAAASADTGEDTSYETLAIPFPFYNESFGFAVGYVYGRAGWPEPQARVLGTVMGGSRGSGMLLLAEQDLRTPWLDRLFIDPFASIGYFGEIEAYINGNPDFPNQDAGRNSSSEDNFVAGEGFDNFARVRFHYLLPVGHGRDQVVPRFEVVDGLAVGGFTGARSLNPLESGRSFITLRPFYRSQEIDGDDLSTTISTNGVDFGLDWDNRDFYPNPTRGQSVSLGVSRGFGLFESSDSWTVVQGEVDQYRARASAARKAGGPRPECLDRRHAFLGRQGRRQGRQSSPCLCRRDARRPVADARLPVPALQRPRGDLLRRGAARDPGV